jgi:hypothetical protein
MPLVQLNILCTSGIKANLMAGITGNNWGITGSGITAGITGSE